MVTCPRCRGQAQLAADTTWGRALSGVWVAGLIVLLGVPPALVGAATEPASSAELLAAPAGGVALRHLLPCAGRGRGRRRPHESRLTPSPCRGDHFRMTVVDEYRWRWTQAVQKNDPRELGTLLSDIWDRLAMVEDEPEARLLIAGVGAEFVAAMKISCERAQRSLPEQFEALGAVFEAIAAGKPVEYELRSGSEKRTVVFAAGARYIFMPDGSEVSAN